HGKGDSGERYSQKLGDFYGACMAEERIEKLTRDELLSQLAPIEQVRSLPDLAKEVARQHLGLGNPLFSLSSQQDYKNATRVIGATAQSARGLPARDSSQKTDAKGGEFLKDSPAHISRMSQLAGPPAAAADAQARIIVAIETKLAQASMARTD